MHTAVKKAFMCYCEQFFHSPPSGLVYNCSAIIWWSLARSCGNFAAVSEFSTIWQFMAYHSLRFSCLWQDLSNHSKTWHAYVRELCLHKQLQAFYVYLLLFSQLWNKTWLLLAAAGSKETQPWCGVAADGLVELQLSVTNPWWSECELTESSCSWLVYQTVLMHYHQYRNFIWECWFW